MYLYITTSAAKDIGHFSLGIRKVVRINFKLIVSDSVNQGTSTARGTRKPV